MGKNETRGVLYVIACGSSYAAHTQKLVVLAQAAGWDVCVITTPKGKEFLNMAQLAQLTGHPVRSEYKRPDEPDLLPPADAMVVFPVTFNTLNKWALGITDTLAVGLLCEYTGYDTPILAAPHTGPGLDNHPAFLRSMRILRRCGVRILYDPETYPPRNHVSPEAVMEEFQKLMQQR
jgi:phosphopantothenoylcysteine synthetase/decarboxylase